MKYFLIPLCAIFMLSCSSSVSYKGNDDDKAEVIKFSRHIQRIMTIGEEAHFLKHVKPEYLNEQLTTNLGGDTTKFLNEFFCGKMNEKQSCMPFQEIMKVKLLEINGQKNNTFSVKYQIENKVKESMVTEVYISKKEETFFIYSAVG